MTLLSLAMLLTGCVSIPVPNEKYLKDCHITYLEGEPGEPSTNGAVVKVAEAREYDLKMCSVDKAALRAWFEAQCRGALKRCQPPRD